MQISSVKQNYNPISRQNFCGAAIIEGSRYSLGLIHGHQINKFQKMKRRLLTFIDKDRALFLTKKEARDFLMNFSDRDTWIARNNPPSFDAEAVLAAAKEKMFDFVNLKFKKSKK